MFELLSKIWQDEFSFSDLPMSWQNEAKLISLFEPKYGESASDIAYELLSLNEQTDLYELAERLDKEYSNA